LSFKKGNGVQSGSSSFICSPSLLRCVKLDAAYCRQKSLSVGDLVECLACLVEAAGVKECLNVSKESAAEEFGAAFLLPLSHLTGLAR
jgi:hypothetical protein